MPEDFLSSWRARYQTPDPEPAAAAPADDFLTGWRNRYQAPAEEEEPERWERRGIIEVNTKTGATRPVEMPGALPTADIDKLHPDLPTGKGFDWGAAGETVLRSAADVVPSLLRMERDTVAKKLGADPSKVKDAIGLTDLIESSGAGLERSRGEVRRSVDSPAGSVAADWGAVAAGQLLDPTALLIGGGSKTTELGMEALARAAKMGDVKAAEKLAVLMARKAAPAPAAKAAEVAAVTLSPEAAPIAAGGSKRISDLSREELLRIATESEKTGLPNARAFAEIQGSKGRKGVPDFDGAAPKPVVVSSDVDSLKWLNDTFGHDAGDELLRRKGQAFKDLGIDGYHLQGDEFAARFDTPEEAGAKMDELRAYLADRPLEVLTKDGQKVQVRVDFSHGLGPDLKSADEALGLSKVARTAERRRGARGEAPPELGGVQGPLPGHDGLQVPGLRGTAEETLAAAPDTAPEILGREGVAYLSDNRPVRFRYVLRDADSVETSHTDAFTVNPKYPHGTGAQPRDLNDPAERMKIEDIAAKYNPARVGPSSSVSGDGAPFFARQTTGRPFMVVGNGRTIAQRQALNNPLKMAEHLEALKAQNVEAGFPDGFLEEAQRLGMKKPVLQRELIGDFDAEALGRDGNIGSTGRLSDLALSQSDAARMSPELLSLVDGERPIDAASNRDFVRGFLGEVVPQVEHASMVGRDGQLTTVGQRRIRNALLGAAYQDTDAIARLVESDGEGIRNVGRGMLATAARLAKQAQLAKAGALYPRDIGPDVAQAAGKLAELRAKGQPVEMYLKQVELDGQEMTDEARFLLEHFDLLKRDQSAVGGVLRRYSELVDSYGDPREVPNLFGDVPEPPTKLELLKEAVATWKQAEGPMLDFGGPSALSASFSDALPGPLGLMLDAGKRSKALKTAGTEVRRWLTSFGRFVDMGEIGPEFGQASRGAWADVAAHEQRAADNLMDFDAALETFSGQLKRDGIDRSKDDIAAEALRGLQGESDMAGLSPALRGVVEKMREHFDEITGGILQTGAGSKDLRLTMEKNLGSYVTRTYEIHRNPLQWEKVVKEQEPWRWENAKRWTSETHPDWTEEQVEGYLNSYFQKDGDAALELAPRSDVFRTEKGIFKHRQQQHLLLMEDGPTRSYPTREAAEKAAVESRDAGRKVTVETVEGMPEPLEQFMGLHTDPRPRYAEGIARMAHDLASIRVMQELRTRGEGKIFFAQETGEFATRLNGNPDFDPLAGMFAKPAVAQVLNGMKNSAEAATAMQKAFYVMARTNASVRLGKAVINPLGMMRNAWSWVGTQVANGHFTSMVQIPKMVRGAKLIANTKLTPEGRAMRMLEHMASKMETVAGQKLTDVFRFDSETMRGEVLDAIRRGVIGEGARSGELSRYQGLFAETKVAQAVAGSKKLETAAKVVTNPMDAMKWFYTKTDDWGKYVSWLMERANYQHAFPEKSATEIKDMTAPYMSDGYPTFSKAVPLVKFLRDLPFGPNFPTYVGEVVRNVPHILKRGAMELASDNPRLRVIGAKRLAGFGAVTAWRGGVTGAAVAGGMAAYNAMAGREGISTEETNAMQLFSPEWNRYDDLIPVEKKGPGKYSVVDVSYVNPYATFRSAWNALADNNFAWDDRVETSVRELLGPFTSENIVAGTIMDLARNRTDDGRQVYLKHQTRLEKAEAMAAHAMKRLEPSLSGQARDLKAGITGKENPKSGRQVDLSKFLMGFLTGTRTMEIDVPKKFGDKAWDLQNTRREIVADYHRKSRRKGASPSEQLDAKVRSNEAWNRALDEMRVFVEGARTTGLSDYQLRQILKAENRELSDETVNVLLNGGYLPVAR